jgi:hypothetical protein
MAGWLTDGIAFGPDRAQLAGYSPASTKGVNSPLYRYLVALIWPAGIALIAVITIAAASKSSLADVLATQPRPVSGRSQEAPGNAQGLAGGTWEPVRLIAIAIVGVIVVFGVMCVLGLLVVHQGLTSDGGQRGKPAAGVPLTTGRPW